uniref:BUB1 N-terminal domain-containing protein n=1 Tax=Phytophthora ramorum TaxID=164328 RepID=H3HDX0_PHYRM
MTRAAPDEAPFSRKRKADDFEWETSKENVVPLKRGRNVADLNMALRAHESFQTKLRLEDEVKAKEDALAVYSGDDPLAGWIDYVRWLEVKMPEDTRKKFKVLEKCTRELKDEPKYRNDMRYVRLWIQYADLVSNPKDIFKYLYQNKIGERVSLFYIGWAYVLETMANYPQAHKIYLKASQKKAEPQDLLERKYKEFQRRMSRQWLRMTEEIGANDIDEVTHRRALESLSAYGTLELNDAQREQLHQHQASTRAQRVQHANAHKPVFIIYEDPVGHSVDPFDGNGGWKKLGSMQQQDKENELAPIGPSKPASTHHDANEDMTINTRVALEDINNMFCSPPRQPKPSVWEVKEDAPVERKLHFKHQAEKMTWSQKRKPLGARDDLVRRGRLTNKDVLLRAEKDAATNNSTESTRGTTERLPRLPCNNPAKRKLRKPIVIEISSTLTLRLVGVLGAGSFAHVFSADIADTASDTICSKAVKFEKERHNLAWEFYITNKIRKKMRVENGLTDEEIPVPKFVGLNLFPNGALLVMDKGYLGTLFDVLNCYKQTIG